MATMIDLGNQGPHPNVLMPLLVSINENATPDSSVVVREGDLHVLQQRTLYGVTWSNLYAAGWAYDEDEIELDVSFGLVLASPPGSRKLLVLYQANRLPGQDWGLAQTKGEWIEDPPKKPWTATLLLSRGLGIGWGVLAHSPDVGKGRISLADGRVAESVSSNGSFLVLVPFNSAQLWSSSVLIGFHDTGGREIIAESLPLGSPPSGS